MGLPAYSGSHEAARRISELLSAHGFTVTPVPIKANVVPAKPSLFYCVSDGRHSATVFSEFDPDCAITIIIPRFSLRFGRSKFVSSLGRSLLAAGFENYPNAKAA